MDKEKWEWVKHNVCEFLSWAALYVLFGLIWWIVSLFV